MILTNEQIEILEALRLRGPNAQGNYSDVYALIYSWIKDSADVGNDVKLWFQGATQANAGTGAFAILIREYSKIQMVLRGVSYSDALMQEASNRVAERAIVDILDETRVGAGGMYTFPDINSIARNDATGVGSVLFASLGGSDTAGGIINAGWSGTLLFSAFGSNQAGRLLTAGDTYSDPQEASTLNRLDDLKNVLFAFYAYGEAVNAAVLGSWNTALELDVQLFTDMGISFDTVKDAITAGNFSTDVVPLLTKKLTDLLPASAKPYGELIEKVGVDQVLAWVMSSYNGEVVAAELDTFVARAALFFNSINASDLQNTKLSFPDNAIKIGELAKSDVNARAALAGLSPFVVEVSPDVASHLDLYDEKTGTGEITEKWIDDRTKALAAYMTYWQRGETDGIVSAGADLPFFQLGDVVISDSGLGGELIVDGIDFGVIGQRYLRFGDVDNDNLKGGKEDDRLYGGAGADNLSGDEGNDYLAAC